MSEKPASFPRSYDSYMDFYSDVYADVVTDYRPAGRIGAVIIEAAQGTGDWSDAPVPDLVLTCIRSGSCDTDIDIGAGRFCKKVGRSREMVLISPQTQTRILLSGNLVLRSLAIPYRSLLGLLRDDAEHLPPDGDFGRVHTEFFEDKLIEGLLENLWTEAEQGSQHGALFADGALLQFAARLLHLTHGKAQLAPHHASGGLAAYQHRKIVEHLHASLAESHSLEMLAGLCNLSTWHFARAFRTSTGLPPHAFLRRLRAEKAMALLRETPLPIQAVATSVGYETPQAFARMFRAEVGASPSEYRRDRRG